MIRKVPFQTVVDALFDDSTPFPGRYLHFFPTSHPLI